MADLWDIIWNFIDSSMVLTFLAENLIWPATLVVIGWVGGFFIERRHMASLIVREEEFAPIRVSMERRPPAGLIHADSVMVTASVVLSKGMFEALRIAIRKLFGGNLLGYERLVARARREAILRLKEAARERGASLVVNLRMTTTRITATGLPAVEILAYGTAIKPL